MCVCRPSPRAGVAGGREECCECRKGALAPPAVSREDIAGYFVILVCGLYGVYKVCRMPFDFRTTETGWDMDLCEENWRSDAWSAAPAYRSRQLQSPVYLFKHRTTIYPSTLEASACRACCVFRLRVKSSSLLLCLGR